VVPENSETGEILIKRDGEGKVRGRNVGIFTIPSTITIVAFSMVTILTMSLIFLAALK
jgi:hypothetical protein